MDKTKILEIIDKINKMTSEKSLIVFQDEKIRRLWHVDEWFYSVSDIIAILTDSKGCLLEKTQAKRDRDNLSRIETACNIWEIKSDMTVKVLEGYGQNQNS